MLASRPLRGLGRRNLIAGIGLALAVGLAAFDYRVAAVLATALLVAGWIWNPLRGPSWERFGGVFGAQIALLIPVGFAARWIDWHLTWAVIVLLLGSVVFVGVLSRPSHARVDSVELNPLDRWPVVSALQVAVVLAPNLVVALPYLTRDVGGHLWLFSRGFDNTAHFNVMSAIAKTGAWPWGGQYADVAGQLIFSPALPQQVWALIARALALGSLPSGDALVIAFSVGQVLAYAFLCFGVLLLMRRLAELRAISAAGKWIWIFGLVLLLVLLSFSSSISLVLNGFANYAWAIGGLLLCIVGAMMLSSKNLALSLTLVISGGAIAAASYAPLVIVAVALAIVVSWKLRSSKGVNPKVSRIFTALVVSTLALAVALIALVVLRSWLPEDIGAQLLPGIYFFPLEALAVTGGIEAIPWLAMGLSIAGALVFLLSSYRKGPLFPVSVASWALVTLLILILVIGAYSISQTGEIAYYTIKLQYALLVLSLPFFVGALVLLFTKWRPKRALGVLSGIGIIFLASQSFGYSLPIGQKAFLETGLPPNYISPGLAWLQLANDPDDYPGLPGELVAHLGTRPADGVIVLWNPPDLDATQERGAQIYPNSMRYTGDTWVWSLANTLIDTDWGDQALEELWNWRWSNWQRPVTIYVTDSQDLQSITSRLSDFLEPEPGGIADCVNAGTCVTEVVLVTLEPGN